MNKENSKVFVLVFLGMLTAFGPFVTDMYLPALPSMVGYFHTTSSMVQLGLTASMIGLALGQLFFGPLSDKYGRRTPLLVAMWMFILSTVCCIFSANIWQFLAFRLFQGIAGAGGIVISRSVATDKFAGRDLAKMLAIIGAINGIAPVAAPVIGGTFTDLIGWRGIFVILLAVGLLLLVNSYIFRESLPLEKRSASSWTDVLHNFRLVMGNREFMFYVLQQACAQGILFGNIASSPFIVQQHYGYSAFVFSLCFGFNAVGIGAGAAISMRFKRAATGSFYSCIGMMVFSVLECVALMSGCGFWVYQLILFPLLLVMGISFTTSTTLAMNREREHAGTASALLGAICFTMGGLVSPIVGLGNILHTTGIVFVCSALLSFACLLIALGHRRARLYMKLSL